MYYKDIGPVDPWLKYLKEKAKAIMTIGQNDGDHGWGTELRQKLFKSACKYMNTDPYIANTIVGVGVNSIFQSDYVKLSGGLLADIKIDPDYLAKRKILVIDVIERDPRHRVKLFDGNAKLDVQFGGERAPEKMWLQLLEIHKWSTDHYATWEVAMNELTWTVRSTSVYVDYDVAIDGVMHLVSKFEDVLDLRPSPSRSPEYNAACYIYGFLYHDIIGGSDELKTKAEWTTVVQPR